MTRYVAFTVSIAFLLSCALCSADTFSDDFSSRPAATGAEPAWEQTGFGWAVRDGEMDARGAEGFLICRAVGYGRQMVIGADMTVHEAAVTSTWRTAGIGVYQDVRNHWRLNLVLAPRAAGGRHYVELQEMLDGVWLAQTEPKSRLEAVRMWQADNWEWEVGVPYRLSIALATDTISGTIAGRDGTRYAEFAYALASERCVDRGWACLAAGGLGVSYDNVSVTVTETVEQQAPTRTPPAQHPAYEPLDPEAPVVSAATGFFRVEEHEGRWWVIDPTGRRLFIVGTDHCNYRAHWCEKLGYAPYHRNCEAKYGSAEAWAESATRRLREWNFQLLGAGGSPEARHRGLAHTEFAALGQGFARREWIAEPINWTGFPDVFSADFEPYCLYQARQVAEPHVGDPWLFGYFLDNELEWYGKTGHLVDDVFLLRADRPAKQALVHYLTERYGSIAALNAAFGTSHADFEALAHTTEVPPVTPALASVRSEFLATIAERYFAVTCNAIRAVDPDHMIIGCRFAGIVPSEALGASSRYLDIFTINTYPRVDLEERRVLETPAMLADIYDAVRRPMIITEWSFPALDAGLPCKHGAGMRVDTQVQKAECYEIFATAIAQLPFMVGYNYFMWVDEPELGISSTFPEDSNYGLVDVNDDPWDTLVAKATAVNAEVARLHAECALDTSEVIRVPELPMPEVRPEDLQGAVEATEEAFEWDLGPLQVAHAAGDGSVLSSIRAGGMELGTLWPLLQVARAGRYDWIRPNSCDAVTQWIAPERRLAEITCAHRPADTTPGAPAFRVACQLLGIDGHPFVLARVLWIENLGTEPLTVVAYFHYPLPNIGGHAADDEPGGPDVPNYYLPSACWTDPVLGGSVGIALLRGSDFSLSFWKDGPLSFHPDCRRAVGRELAPGERWASDEPWVAVYGFPPSEPEGWKQVTRPWAAWRALIAGSP